MAEIIKGREIAKKINNDVKEKILNLTKAVGRSPRLVSLIVGKSEGAEIYINMQKKAANLVGIKFDCIELDKNISQGDLIAKIDLLNKDEDVTAIIIQKPVPDGIDHDRAVANILPYKDAEGIHPYNLGKILRREADIVPCTPGAIMKILNVNNIDLYGKEVVIIGHSAIVGKPLSLMMMNEMATTTVCHKATDEKSELRDHTKRADILIVAVGIAEMIKGEWIKEGAIVIDVGINRVNGKIVGDVEADSAESKASLLTPVPGGVGPVTVSILMRNVCRAFRSQND